MAGPGFWSDVGRRTTDLLNKDFSADQKFSVTSTTSTGLTFTSLGTKKGEEFHGDFTTTFVNYHGKVDVKVDTHSKIFATVTLDEPAPGLKTIFSFGIPDQKSKLELKYAHPFAGVTTVVGLTSSPVVDCTAAFGNNEVVLGGETSFDTASGNLTKYNVGLGFNKHDFSAAVTLADKGDTIKASYSHDVRPLATVVGAEMSYKLSTKENTFSIGGMYALDPLTSLKARINNQGKLGGVIQHEWRPKSTITVSGEVDVKSPEKNTKVGLSLALKP